MPTDLVEENLSKLWPESGPRLGEGDALEQVEDYVYVTDMETYEILYMNEAVKRAFGVEDFTGLHCWEVIQTGMDGPCPFCPVPNLSADEPERSSYTWKRYNSFTGHTYSNFDSVMRWPDGRMVHVQRASDLTRIRQRFFRENTDDITGLLAWEAGRDALKEILRHYSGRMESYSICALGLNHLNQINLQYSHRGGDAQIAAVAQAVRRQLAPDDRLFRYKGDKFVAVLFGTGIGAASRRMRAAQRVLEKLAPYPLEGKEIFSFGVVETSVADRVDPELLVAAADRELYHCKRELHIRRSAKSLEERESIFSGGGFTYDKERLYDALVQSTDDYLYLCDMKTGMYQYPQAMVDEFDLPGQVLEQGMAILATRIHDHDKALFLAASQEVIDGRSDSHVVEYRALNRKGEWQWLRCRGRLERDENGAPSLLAGFITNLGKRNKVDHLTGLMNKFELENELSSFFTREKEQMLALMLMNMDDFKHVNNLYNREFGDEVLRMTAQKLQTLMPTNGTVYRLDGDEFAVLLTDAGRAEAKRLFSEIQRVFARQQECDNKKFYCGLTSGCAVAPTDGNSYLDLMKHAHYALDYAKGRGKNCQDFFSRDILLYLDHGLQLTELLRESVEQDFRGFELYYQPVFSPERKIHGAEALARWTHPKLGRVAPEEFIVSLESSGLILPFGRWVFRRAIQDCATLVKRCPDFSMCVNLSCLQLEDSELFDYLRQALEDFDLDAGHVVLEITESFLAANMDKLRATLESLHAMGFRVAMDDFGTGYSSLSRMKDAPVDIVKIDRSFVSDIQDNTFDSAFIRLIVELCHIISIEVYLEGVETEPEFELTKPLGINYFQGFLLGHPTPLNRFIQRFLN